MRRNRYQLISKKKTNDIIEYYYSGGREFFEFEPLDPIFQSKVKYCGKQIASYPCMQRIKTISVSRRSRF